MRKKRDFTHCKIAFLGYKNLKTTKNQVEMGSEYLDLDHLFSVLFPK